ncbi:hypothetical protein CI109_107325 [Kwoniella shandongensis]|uniref:Mitochondrial import inner membrane translocase subunit TIM54 n=1 Tax=Kwoniella shandongensis TaxID=1734106 RepID=A0A5M6BXS1_9TREE|nr:uncharacterized protein CI109_004747 [Kwoniella shandongensis]KAA5526970.1 hypothetical protein CI109_004747 [Kwoniella shandongensis]
MSDPTPTPPAPPPPTPPPAQGNYGASPALPPTPGGASPASTPSAPAAPAPAAPAAGAGSGVKPGAAAPLEPLTGFRSALEHTGLPRSVLLYKPRLPSRNWLIFWTILGSVSATYYYDRSECKRIKKETISRVEAHGQEPLPGGSLGVPRQVVVWGGKWGGDDDEDRALRHFRKYVKPYLVAAGIDYHLPTSPLHGSITRQVHAQILSTRRQALGLEPIPPRLDLPGVLSPDEVRQKELEGGIVLVGRQSLKEFTEGLRRGWMGGVDEWDWEKEVEAKLKNDGVFEPKLEEMGQVESEEKLVDPAATAAVTSPETTGGGAPSPSKPIGGLGFLSRPTPPVHDISSTTTNSTSQIPQHWHVPPSPLPAQPPILLLPFVSHVGFTQIPNMIASWFNERHRVLAGSQAAIALIESTTRPLHPSDLEFDRDNEKYYNKAAKQLPERIATARKDYYDALAPRVEEARKYEYGEREQTDEEKKTGKVVRLDELKEERKKKELRWTGNEEGWEIVKPEKEVTWDDRWDGWLKVFDLSKGDGESK